VALAQRHGPPVFPPGALEVAAALRHQREASVREGGRAADPKLLSGGERLLEPRRGAVQVVLRHRQVRQPAQLHHQLGGHAQLPGLAQPLPESRLGPLVAAMHDVDHAEQLQRLHHPPAVAELAEAPQAHLAVLGGTRQVPAHAPGEPPQLPDHRGGPAPSPLHLLQGLVEGLLGLDGSADGEEPERRRRRARERGLGRASRAALQGGLRLLRHAKQGVMVSYPVRLCEAEDVQGLAAYPVGHRPRQGERVPERAGNLLAVAHHEQPEAQRSQQPHGERSLAAVQQPMPRGPQVVQLRAEAGEPRQLLAPVELRLGRLRQPHAPFRVSSCHPIAITRLGEPLGGVGPHRLQQAVAHRVAGGLGLERRWQPERLDPRPPWRRRRWGRPNGDQGLVDQPGDRLRDRHGGQVPPGAHRLGGVKGAATHEHRKPSQGGPLGAVEQLPAPIHHRPQGLLARQRGARARGEQPEALVQPRGQLVRRQRTHPCGGQLDRQRQPVELSAHLPHRGGIAPVTNREPGDGRGGAVQEQPGGGEAGELLGVHQAGWWDWQRRHGPAHLPGHS